MGSLDAATGKVMPWAANRVIRDYGPSDGIDTLTTDGTQIYGGGVVAALDGLGNFEGRFAADPLTGKIAWLNDCHGDTYGVLPVGKVLYSVGHTHDCTAIGSFSNPSPLGHAYGPWYRAVAQTTYPTGKNAGPDSYGWNFAGQPDSTLLDWFPVLTPAAATAPAGTVAVSGSVQSAWSITASADGTYIALGGEFPSVGDAPTVAQQGLVRFAVHTLAPNKIGPYYNSTSPPTVALGSLPGTATVTINAAWDRDSQNLTYQLRRDGTLIWTTAMASTFWSLPQATFVDTGLKAGPHVYQVTVVDPDGNKVPRSAPAVTITTTGGPAAPTPASDLALGKPAIISAIYGATQRGTAATDGMSSTVAIANRAAQSWWQTDLLADQPISSITVNGRAGSQGSNVWLFASSQPLDTRLTPAQQAAVPGVWSQHVPGYVGASTVYPVPVGTTARYIMVQHDNTDYLSLNEVSVQGVATPGAPTNLALDRPALQSSTFAAAAAASNAVDGDVDGAYADGSVSITNANANAWWQADLQSPQSINSLNIYNRTDSTTGTRLSDYWVFVSNTRFDTTLTPTQQAAMPGVWSSHQTTIPSPSVAIPVPVGTIGRYVMVQLSSAQNLQLAEVQVMGSARPDLALGKAATQSSNYAPTTLAALAVDGNVDGTYAHGSVTSTNPNAYAWWQVDLGSSSPIDSVAIFNRNDSAAMEARLSNYWVFVSNTPFNTKLTPAQQATQPGVRYLHELQTPAPSLNVAMPVGTTGRYVMIQENSGQYLSLAEVQVFGNPQPDLALGKVATQSSTPAATQAAALAVDGNPDGNINDRSVSVTNANPNAWWQVDLGATTPIKSIQVFNRTDNVTVLNRLGNYWVFVSNTPFNSKLTPAQQATQPGVWSSHQVSVPNPDALFTLPANSTGRYVLIQQNGTQYLHMAEVEVH
jgi:hypothetical protein